MKKYWFKPKSYGYGMYPTSWQGFLSIFLLLGILLLSAYSNGIFNEKIIIKEAIRFLLDVFIFAGLFSALFSSKVEGGLKWRWGRSNK